MKRFMGPVIAPIVAICMVAAAASAADVPPPVNDPVQGQYEGVYMAPDGSTVQAEAEIVGQSAREYRVRLWTKPTDGSDKIELTLNGKRPSKYFDWFLGDEVRLKGGEEATEWRAVADQGSLIVQQKGSNDVVFSLSRVFRVSPTEGAVPPEGAVLLFPYKKGEKTNLEEWQNKKWPLLDDGSAVVSGDNRSVRKFGDCQLHVEFWLPYEPEQRGQGRGNSGVYLQAYYEVQVLDSFGLKPEKGDCGAIYRIAVPPKNVCFPPERWQTYDIDFRAARFDNDGNVTERPVISVRHNGVLTHDKVSIPRGTEKGKPGGEPKVGPIRLQDHGHPVRYRNIWLVEK